MELCCDKNIVITCVSCFLCPNETIRIFLMDKINNKIICKAKFVCNSDERPSIYPLTFTKNWNILKNKKYCYPTNIFYTIL